MPEKLSKENLMRFVKQVKTASDIDFPRVAKQLGYDWFTQIKPRLSEDWFRVEMDSLLEEIKFSLLQGVFRVAQDGKAKGRGELQYVNAIIKLIDSGTFLGKGVSFTDEPDDYEIQRHMERLGLKPVAPSQD